MVDAFAESAAQEAGPSVVYPDQFRAAQEALSQGLRAKPVSAAKPSFPSPAEIRQVVAVKPAQDVPTVRRIKSPPIAPSLDEGFQDIPFIDDEAAPPRQEKPQPRAQPASAVARPASLPKAPKAAPQNEERIKELEQQLREAKSQLAAAELEVSRLSSIIQSSSRARLNLSTQATPPLPVKAPVEQLREEPKAAAVAPSVADEVTDMQVATVSVDKADLRLGPGKNHSALMTLRRGSRLAIEARQGEWYRVFAPNGQRAWIHSSLVQFGAGAASLNDGSSVKVRGYKNALE
jgi:hypothetical protein